MGLDLICKRTGMAGLALAVGHSAFAQSDVGDVVESVVPACSPVSGSLGSDATLAAQAGRYRLTLVQRIDGMDVASAEGTLVLHRQGQETPGTVSTPLYGAADVDLGKVHAHQAGDIGSERAEAPGVLVLEFDRDGTRYILLRLGSAANRRDRMLPDGPYTVMEVREISEDGFSGSWRSGLNEARAGGYFCAKGSLRSVGVGAILRWTDSTG